MLGRLILNLAEKCVPRVKIEDVQAEVERRHNEAAPPKVLMREDLKRPLIRRGKRKA